ncbi:MAG: hypothetical protein ACI4Q3_07395 [Kiritimatiellia bacterium]
MKRNVLSAGALGLGFVLCSCCAWFCQQGRSRAREQQGVAPNPVAEMIVAGLGGFRGIAAEVVWFRADRLQDEGRYAELAQLATWLTFLDPYTPEVWAYSAWNLAYNISVMMPTHEDRWRWVESGMRLLRDDGLRLNPGDPVLHKELAWLFLLKLGGDLDEASPFYREKWAAQIGKCRQTADWSPVRMDPALCAEIDREYGAQDWLHPFASALYWAHKGLPLARGKKNVRQELRQIVYQVLMLEARDNPKFAARAYRELCRGLAENPNPVLEKIARNFKAHYNLSDADGK